MVGRVTILDTLAADAFEVQANRRAQVVAPAHAQVTPAFGQQRDSRVRSQQGPARHPQAIAHLRIQPSRVNGLVPAVKSATLDCRQRLRAPLETTPQDGARESEKPFPIAPGRTRTEPPMPQSL